MNYAIVIQGEGRGHLSQAIAIKQMLQNDGHNICCVLAGRGIGRKPTSYIHKQFKAPVIKYFSPFLVKTFGHRGIDINFTLLINTLLSIVYVFSIFKMHRVLKRYKPHAVLNFYEPLVGLLFSVKKVNAAHFCFGHHFLTQHYDFPLPLEMPLSRRLLFFMNKVTALKAQKVFALSFKPKDRFNSKKWLVAPPILRHQIICMKPMEGEFYLGYMLDYGHSKDVIEWHEKNPHIKAVMFWNNPKMKGDFEYSENLVFYQLDHKKFIQYLANCKAFISTAGFESICEAIYFQKPYVVVPTQNHFEQLCNANDAHLSGKGIMAKRFNPNLLTKLLSVYEDIDQSSDQSSEWFKQSERFYLKELTDINVKG